MSKGLINHPQEFFKALFECLADVSPVPIGYYLIKNGEVIEVIPESSHAKYVSHCKLIQSFEGGKQNCEKDQLERAKAVIESNQDLVVGCCWAGIYNVYQTIKIDGKIIGLFVYGGGQVKKDGDKNVSINNHRTAIKKLRLSNEQATDLEMHFRSIEPCSDDSLVKIRKTFEKAERLISDLWREQNRAKHISERDSHEIATRLQAVIAEAENLIFEVDNNDFSAAKKIANSVLNTAESLNTVAQNLGNYLEAYQFRRQSLKFIIDKSIKFYEAEAARKHVEIIPHIQHPSDVEVSENQLQYAFNNLIQNAIKYSFSGGYNHQRKQYLNRYIKINGQREKEFYCITISNYGVGIMPDEYELIFQEDYQGRLTGKEYRTGSGKGLSFAKRIIDEHNGTIKVESSPRYEDAKEENKPYTTEFTVRLPYNQPR